MTKNRKRTADDIRELKRLRAAAIAEYEAWTATCRWFAKCGRPATTTTPHPRLGDVPTCARCHKFATTR